MLLYGRILANGEEERSYLAAIRKHNANPDKLKEIALTEREVLKQDYFGLRATDGGVLVFSPHKNVQGQKIFVPEMRTIVAFQQENRDAYNIGWYETTGETVMRRVNEIKGTVPSRALRIGGHLDDLPCINRPVSEFLGAQSTDPTLDPVHVLKLFRGLFGK